jgi:Lrp/AsnC family transcriptional regulator for asnA, asnC and gidA
VQRRTRKIIEKEIVMQKIHLNYEKFGLRTGLIHIYLREGNIEEICRKVSEIEGITSIEIHIGNSDIIANLAFGESKNMLDAILKIKEMDGIDHVIWSERVLQYPVKNKVRLMIS